MDIYPSCDYETGKPLLVCFDTSIRLRLDSKGNTVNNILITSPKDRKTFTEEQCKLVSGQPYSSTDQDSYTQLMSMDDKEIVFWKKAGKRPLFEKECGMDWDAIQRDYDERMAIKLKRSKNSLMGLLKKTLRNLKVSHLRFHNSFMINIMMVYSIHTNMMLKLAA